MKIDKIKKMSNNKYKIYFDDDNVLETYDEVIINTNLLYKKEIDEDLYRKIQDDNAYYEIYNKCVKMLSSKMRSKKEMYDFLVKKGIDKADIDNMLSKLELIGLLNDKMYAKAYISDKVNFTNMGPLKIESNLLDCDIDESIIREELSKLDSDIMEKKISKYINSKARSNKHSTYFFKEKVLSELLSLGYSKDMILPYLEDIKLDSNVKLEYNKIYNKLSRKYKDEELKRNIRNKLYQKGYTKEEIESVLDM